MNVIPEPAETPDALPSGAAPAFGPRVRAVRIARGISLRALARRLGVSPATLSKIETGKASLSAERLYDLLHVLGDTSEAVPQGGRARAENGEPVADVGPADLAPARTGGRAVDVDPGAWRTFAPLDWDPVLTAALEAFVAVGYHGATVRDIASRAGLSVPGMYHYYPGKQDMLVAILDRTMTDLLWRSAAARAEGRNPAECFARLIESLVLFHTYRREPAFIGASEMRSLQAGARERIAARRVEQQRMIDTEVEAGVREGRFRTAHPHDAARAAVTMCLSTTQWYRPDGPLSPEEIAERYVAFALQLMQVASAARRQQPVAVVSPSAGTGR